MCDTNGRTANNTHQNAFIIHILLFFFFFTFVPSCYYYYYFPMVISVWGNRRPDSNSFGQDVLYNVCVFRCRFECTFSSIAPLYSTYFIVQTHFADVFIYFQNVDSGARTHANIILYTSRKIIIAPPYPYSRTWFGGGRLYRYIYKEPTDPINRRHWRKTTPSSGTAAAVTLCRKNVRVVYLYFIFTLAPPVLVLFSRERNTEEERERGAKKNPHAPRNSRTYRVHLRIQYLR